MKKYILLLLGLFINLSAFAADKTIFFDAGTTAKEREAAVRTMGARIKKKLPAINAVVVSFPKTKGGKPFEITLQDMQTVSSSVTDEEDDKYLKWIRTSEAVDASQMDTSVTNVLTAAGAADIDTNVAADSVYTVQGVPWNISKIEAPAAWQNGLTGRGVVVAVIDTGVRLSHPDLKDNIAGGYNVLNPSQPPLDAQGHGTHVAGIIAASNNNFGVVGVAPNAKILAVKALDDTGYATNSQIAEAILWAAENGAQVINLSVGTASSSITLKRAVEYAFTKNITIVASSGNDGKKGISYPAAYDNVISVGSSNFIDARSWFSNYGNKLDYVLPGERILSTYTYPEYVFQDGTSMAAPHAAGLAALAIEAGARTPADVRAAFERASQPLPNVPPDEQGRGYIMAGFIGRR